MFELEKKLASKRVKELTGNRAEGIAKSRAARDAAKQRMTGGDGLGAGAATTSAAVNSGMGDLLAKPTISGPQSPITDINKISNNSRNGSTIADQILLGKDSIPTEEYGPTPADAPRSQESTRAGSSMNTMLGGGSLARADEGNAPAFDRTNTSTNSGTFSTFEAPDYEGAFNAMRDLRDYKNKTGAYEQQDRPMTVIGATPSYSQAMADYNSGDLRSPGYEMIRRERMDLRNQLDEATKGMSSSKAKNAAREQVLGAFSEQQKTRLAGETDVEQANIAAGASQYKAGLEAQSDAAARQQEAFFKSAGLEKDYAAIERQREADIANQNLNAARLGFDQAKEAEGIRQFETRYGEGGLEQQRLEIDAGKEVVSAQSRSINDRIKQAEAELAAYKGAGELGEVDPKIRREIMRRNGLLDYEPTEE